MMGMSRVDNVLEASGRGRKEEEMGEIHDKGGNGGLWMKI